MDVSGELKGDSGTTSTAGNNRFIASGTTLTAGDRLDGGAGADVLAITTTAAASLGAGVVTAGIEEVSATATGGALDLNVGTFADATTLTSTGSTAGVTFSNVQVIPTVNLTATSSDVTVSMAAAATAGLADAITVNLNSVATNGSNSVTVNGIEKVTVVGTGSSGKVNADGSVFATTIVSDAVRELVISGSGTTDLAINLAGAQTGTTGAAATVTGSAGADDLQLSTPAAASKVSANLGAGDDVVRVSNVNAAQTISGGDGTDTLVYTGTAAVDATASAGLTSFEKVVLTGPASFALATSDLTYTTAASGTYTGLAAGAKVALNAGGTLTLANTALTGTTDAVAVTVGTATSTAPVAATIAAGTHDVVTVTGVARSDVLSTTSATYNVSGTTLNTVNLVSSQGAVLAGGGAALTTINASGVKGAFSSTATVSSTAALSITGGEGNDNIAGGTKADVLVGNAGNDTLTGGVGADTLTGGAGNDTFVIGANGGTAETAFSTSTVTDVIADFETGKDRLQLSQTVNAFVGNVANVQLGLAAMTAANQAFFVVGENTLYVVSGFANNAGVIANTDTIVKLTGVTALAAADLAIGSSAGGADLTQSASAASVLLSGTSTGVAVTPLYTANLTTNTTGLNDTVRTTAALLNGGLVSTITGGNGSDTLVIQGGGQVLAARLANVTGFEQFTLAETTVVGGATTAVDVLVDDVNVAAVDGTLAIDASGVSTVAVTIDGSAVNNTVAPGVNTGGRLNITGGSFATAAGDILTGGSNNDTISGGAGNDSIIGGLGNDVLNGGTGDDTIVAAGTDIIDGGAGNDVVQIAAAIGTSTTNLASIELGAGVNSLALATGANTALASVAATGGVYSLAVATGAAVTVTQAQHAGAFQVTAGDAASQITFSANGSVDVSQSAVSRYVLSAGTTGTGANTVTVGATQTNITGADGNDTISVASGAAAVAVLQGTVALGNGTADTIQVTGNTATTATLTANLTGVEVITFANTSTNVVLNTAAVNLTLTASAANLIAANTLTFDGTAAAAVATVYSVTGGLGADVLTGGGGADTLIGGGGTDSIVGGAGNDNISGGDGIDTLLGGVGNDVIGGGAAADVITGGTGADIMTGGAGIDNFIYTVADGAAASTLTNLDRIVDYRLATGDNAGALDTITVTGLNAAAVQVGSVATVQDFSALGSLGAALNAAALANTVANGLSVFIFGGNTYGYIEAVNGTTYAAGDYLVEITGTPFTTSTALTATGFIIA